MERVFHSSRSGRVLDIQCPMSLIISKRLINLKTISLSNKTRWLNKNKKAAIRGARLIGNDNVMKDNKEQALALLDKYMKVLNEIEGDKKNYPKEITSNIGKGFLKVFQCSCPNHDAHNHHSRDKGDKIDRLPSENGKFRIGIQESKDPEKYGKYVLSYVCFAYGMDNKGACSFDNLNKLFKEKFNLSPDARHFRKQLEPNIFPRNDESWQDVKGCGKFAKSKHKWKDIAGGTRFIRYYIDDGMKKVFPISYSRMLRDTEYSDLKNEGGFIGKLLWEAPFDPYNLQALSKMWQQENKKDFKVAYIHEGEKKCDKAIELFPNVWNTCLYNLKGEWQKSRLDWFKKFDYVVGIPDNEHASEFAFNNLMCELLDMGIDSRLVRFPVDFKKAAKDGWDIADAFPKGFTIDDYKQWIEEAKAPRKREPNDYSDLKQDAYAKRYVHLTNDKKFHYDRWTKEVEHNDNLNLWYNNDIETRDLRGKYVTNACKYLHQVGCPKVKGLAYRPIDKEFIQEGKYTYVNSYVPYKPIELSEEEYDEKIIEPFLFQIKILSNFEDEAYNFFLDKVAYSIQYPEKNIKFSTLIVSDSYGTGKSYLWQCLTEILGGIDYVVWIRADDVFHKFRPWMANRSLVIVDELRVEGNEREKQKQADALKGLITETTHMIEPKGVNPYQIKNQFTLFMSTNHDTMGIVKKLDERRYFILNCLMTRNEINTKYPNHFDKLVSLSEDKEALRHLRHFFKFKHSVSDYFKTRGYYEPYKTTAFKNMVKTSQSQLWNNLDELYYSLKKPFSLDIGTTRELYEYFKNEDFNKGTKDWKEATEEVLREYCKSKGKVLNKGEAVPNIDGNDKHKRTRGLYAWRNAAYWNEQKPMQWRLHRQRELFAPEFREKQEELFNDIIVSKNQPNLGNENETTRKREA